MWAVYGELGYGLPYLRYALGALELGLVFVVETQVVQDAKGRRARVVRR